MRQLTLCLIALLAVTSFGCVSHEGQLAILMTSGATATTVTTARQVNVEITSVELWDTNNDTWVTVASGRQTHELVGLSGRVSPIALVNAIERGNYTQIRINFDSAGSSVVTDTGRRDNLRVDPSTVTVQALAAVVEDAAADVVLELDLGASLSQRTTGAWLLRPVVRQVAGSAR
jgi:hypothetical protein